VSDGSKNTWHPLGDIPIKRGDEPPPPCETGVPGAAGDGLPPGEGASPGERQRSTDIVRPAPPRRRRGWTWLLPLFCLGLGVYTVGGFLILPGLLRTALIRWGSEQLGMAVRIDLVRCNPFTGRLSIQGLEAAPAGRKGPPALAWREAALRLSPSSLWHRALMVKSLSFDTPVLRLIRQEDHRYNLEPVLAPLAQVLEGAMREGRRERPGILPFALHDIELRGGRLTFEDQPQGKTHVVEELHLVLPRLATVSSSLPSTRAPEFSARINGSPVSFSGAGTGAEPTATELKFQLHHLDLVQYQNYWPWPQPGLVLRGGSADSELSIKLDDGPETRLTVAGTIDLHEVVLDRGDSMVLRLPAARVVFSADPLRRQFHLRNVLLRGMEGSLRVTGAPPAAVGAKPVPAAGEGTPSGSAPAGALGLRLDQLLLEQGRFVLRSGEGAKERHDELRELRLVLRNFANQAARALEGVPREEQSVLEFEALSPGGASEAAISLRGSLNEELRLDARLAVQNLDLAWYQALLPGLAQVRSVAGRGRLEGRLTTGSEGGGGLGLRLREGGLTLTDFSWQDEQWGHARGKELACQGFSLDVAARQGHCERLQLREVDLRPGRAALAALLGPGGKSQPRAAGSWRWQVNDCVVTNSLWRLALPQEHVLPAKRPGGGAELVLADVSLQAAGLLAGAPGEANNFVFSARLGDKGQVQANGVWKAAGTENKLQLAVRDVSLPRAKPLYAPWLRSEVSGGRLHLRGSLAFPGGRFTGMAWLEEVRLGRDDAARLELGKVFASGLAFSPSPYHLGISELVVQRPDLVLPPAGEEGDAPAGVEALLHLPAATGSARKGASATIAIAPVEVQRIEVEDGALRLPVAMLQKERQAELKGLKGRINDFRLLRGSRYSYDLTARPGKTAAEAGLVLRGEGSLGEGVVSGLVEGRRLPPFLFAELPELGNVEQAWMDFVRQWPEGADGATVNRLTCRGLRPRNPASPLAGALALLTDSEGLIRLQIDEMPGEEAPPPLATAIARQLRRYGVKAELSPSLLLAETWPGLQAADEVRFAAGSDALDEPARQALAVQAELLRQRPALLLRLRPGYDPVIDRAALQEVMQREADARRAEENQRREQLRQERTAAELKRLAAEAAKGGGKSVTVESLPPDPPELAPLPSVTVEVPVEQLRQLARTRGEAARDHLLREPGMASRRVLLEEAVSDTAESSVRFALGADFGRAEFRPVKEPAGPPRH